MEYEYPQEINGINLADYYPNQQSYNSVVYIRKKCIQKQKKDKKIEKEKKEKETKEKKAKKKSKNTKCVKCDKCQQYETECNNEIFGMNNSLLAQGLHFTKAMVPVVIPPSSIVSPVYYTIKATKKIKDKKKPKQEISTLTHTLLKKEKSKKVVETYRNEGGKESLSVKETISYSSHSDTLDELQINPSLCCTFSEISDHKQVKKEKKDKLKHESQKMVTSESFEALATEFLNNSGDTKIKIHLMNETEKNVLAENIRVPVLNAIRECILEVNNQRQNAESATVQKFVRCNNQKLDSIFDKLACIEQKLDYIHTENVKPKAVPQRVHIEDDKTEVAIKSTLLNKKTQQPSTLEILGEDLLEIVEDDSIDALEMRPDSSGDEYYRKPTLSARKKSRGKSAVVRLGPMENNNVEKKERLGGGEESTICEPNASQSAQLVRPDRPGRIPARFCWTDSVRKNTAP